ncbi:hypothetical protein OQZ33_17295 [Pedobacter sp. MC2016-05]|uniref:hypothetical protein n=1 Tax=Pedobacter sp. MC2016-05 TaxID=2994474 RepID=UPI002245B2F4|nr:hypothetical protein [Pedobacter sp. MC2016-05]MCX2476093.1 hypothetical protein [Pedobacter sp. MC2016-05]
MKVSQKTNKGTGEVIGQPYLVVDKHFIQILCSFEPYSSILPIKMNFSSNRSYRYVHGQEGTLPTFSEIRERAYEMSRPKP